MKLTIKRKEDAKGSAFDFINYDFMLDGKQVDCKSLSRINLDLRAANNPKLTLEYGITDIEIDDLYPEISKTKTGGGEPLGSNHTGYITKPHVTGVLTKETLSDRDIVKTEVGVFNSKEIDKLSKEISYPINSLSLAVGMAATYPQGIAGGATTADKPNGSHTNRVLPSDYFAAKSKDSFYNMTDEQEQRIFQILKNTNETYESVRLFIKDHMLLRGDNIEEAISMAEIRFGAII